MSSLSLHSHLGFLNTALSLGREYEEFGCSPKNIQCFVSRVNEKTGNIWLKPIKTNALDKELGKLCQLFLMNIDKKEHLNKCDIGSVGLCVTKSGDLIGRVRIVGKDRKKRPTLQCIDTGVIYGSLDESCIYKLDDNMMTGNFEFPLCFVARSLPSSYLTKYRMLGATDIHVGDFLNVNIINITGTIVHALFSSCTKMITSVKYDYIGLDAFRKRSTEWSQFCDNNKYHVKYKDDCHVSECHEINDANTDGYVVGVHDEETIYVRPVSLSIAYSYFLDSLTGSYSVGEFNKLLSVERVVSDDIGKTFVFFDSITTRFYRVEITAVGSKKFSCYCIDQPSLLFLNIDNDFEVLWRLTSTFSLPRFYCKVKLGDFKNRNSIMSNKDTSSRRISVLKNLFKGNNLVTVERRVNRKFLTVRHEELDLVENYKDIMFNTYRDEMGVVTSNSGIFKEPSLRKKGTFASSMNASFKGKGEILGQSLKMQCSMKIPPLSPSKTSKITDDDIFAFGSFKTKKRSVEDSSDNVTTDFVNDELADELCERVNWDLDFGVSQSERKKIDQTIDEFLKLNIQYAGKMHDEKESSLVLRYQNLGRPDSSLSNSTTTSKESTRSSRAVRFKDISFKDSLDNESGNNDTEEKLPDVSDCDSGVSNDATSSTENVNYSDKSAQSSYIKKKLKFTKRCAVVKINNVNDIRIFDDVSLGAYLNNRNALLRLDKSQLKKVSFDKTMPDTKYILECKNERYRVFTKYNYMDESGDSDSDQSSTSSNCQMSKKESNIMDTVFIECDTKRQFTFNSTTNVNIYECPDEIKNLPILQSEIVSLAGEHNFNLEIRDYLCVPKATEFLRSLLPPFKLKSNANIKFTTNGVGGKRAVIIRNDQGKSISPLFLSFCQKLAEGKE
uniref:Tudor domain-containing protein n=1 Tax=Strongyloides venezuelensis TaxID=75913 RepID=A0A0K0F944_STRVS